MPNTLHLRPRTLVTGGAGFIGSHLCRVDDLIDTLIKLMATDADLIGPTNLGNPGEFSVLELARKVIDYTGSRSEIVFEPLPADDPRQRRPDIDFARRTLSWQPHTALDDGLVSTIAYFDQLIPRGGTR